MRVRGCSRKGSRETRKTSQAHTGKLLSKILHSTKGRESKISSRTTKAPSSITMVTNRCIMPCFMTNSALNTRASSTSSTTAWSTTISATNIVKLIRRRIRNIITLTTSLCRIRIKTLLRVRWHRSRGRLRHTLCD